MTPDLAEPLTPEGAEHLSDRDLVGYAATIWADPDLRAVLGGNREFLLERIRYFGRRSYLTAQERQGLARVLFAGPSSVQKRVLDVRRKRDQPSDGMDG